MERVKDSSMAILCFVCLLNYFIPIKVSVMTNILVVLKRNENWPITTITTTINTSTTTTTTTTITTINTTSAIATNNSTTSFTIAIHLLSAHRE